MSTQNIDPKTIKVNIYDPKDFIYRHVVELAIEESQQKRIAIANGILDALKELSIRD